MNKTPWILICALLIVALAVPALANGTSTMGRSISKVPGKVYSGTKAVLVETEGHLTGMLREAFGLFNPCLDLVKCCTRPVLVTLEKPFDYAGRYVSKRAKSAASPAAAGKSTAPKK